ncbi:MAG: hypothetical protein K0S68_182 [Candidatus Saccharibacteria bacterium]|jgi:hypothetical protein|nr:hypothetical protein [Candidatus Saccharibacteria bacterium]
MWRVHEPEFTKPKHVPENESFVDLNNEIRLLLHGAQVLTAFLMILPFSTGFDKIADAEKWVYGVMFLCSLTATILFTAPAAQHRIERPLRDRVEFKQSATKYAIAGMVPMSVAWILAAQLVVTQVLGPVVGTTVAVIVTIGIAAAWWVVPLVMRKQA